MDALRQDKHYTYADYLTWGGEARYELIDGVPYLMSAPSWEHQRYSGRIYAQLSNFLDGKPCEAFAAPFDVRLNAGQSDDTVVQPDIVVICDRSILDGTGCKGAPDFVVEILSPSPATKDCMVKREKYRTAGVREYWSIDSDTKNVQVDILINGVFQSVLYTDAGDVPAGVLPGCVIDMQKVFSE